MDEKYCSCVCCELTRLQQEALSSVLIDVKQAHILLLYDLLIELMRASGKDITREALKDIGYKQSVIALNMALNPVRLNSNN